MRRYVTNGTSTSMSVFARCENCLSAQAGVNRLKKIVGSWRAGGQKSIMIPLGESCEDCSLNDLALIKDFLYSATADCMYPEFGYDKKHRVLVVGSTRDEIEYGLNLVQTDDSWRSEMESGGNTIIPFATQRIEVEEEAENAAMA